MHASHGTGFRHVVLGIGFYPGIRIACVSGYRTCFIPKMTIKGEIISHSSVSIAMSSLHRPGTREDVVQHLHHAS